MSQHNDNPRYTARTRGYTARVLDSERLNARVRTIIGLTYGHFNGIDNCVVEPLVLVEIVSTDSWGKPRIAIIGHEGVGWRSDEDSRLVSVPVWSNNGMTSANPVDLHVDVLRDYLTDEVVDLADWVRVFGDRLDSNLYLWQDQMPTPDLVG